jgi:phenylpyruvate tautomerase PptA (4-oxalocrotonate tautomerase family)
MVVNEHADGEFVYSRNYLDIERGEGFVMIQITVSNTRDVEQKQALYAKIVSLLADDPGLRPQDVFINLLEVAKENWSFDNGIAQYV